MTSVMTKIAMTRFGFTVETVEQEIFPTADLSKPCESSYIKCENPATFMIWCDHHIQGCDYSGYRCNIHRNLLELESRRQIDAIRSGIKCVCAKCDEVVVGDHLSDHFRWIPL